LLIILGVWKLPGGIILVPPRFRLLKEWVYAGMFFTYTGAVASHISVGDGFANWIVPAFIAVFTIVSWALRPSSRKLV
jgi:DoxX-like family